MTRTRDNSPLHRNSGTGFVPPLGAPLSVVQCCGWAAAIFLAFALSFCSGFVLFQLFIHLAPVVLPTLSAVGLRLSDTLPSLLSLLHVGYRFLSDINWLAPLQACLRSMERTDKRLYSIANAISDLPILAQPEVRQWLIVGLTVAAVCICIDLLPYLVSLDFVEASGEGLEPGDGVSTWVEYTVFARVEEVRCRAADCPNQVPIMCFWLDPDSRGSTFIVGGVGAEVQDEQHQETEDWTEQASLEDEQFLDAEEWSEASLDDNFVDCEAFDVSDEEDEDESRDAEEVSEEKLLDAEEDAASDSLLLDSGNGHGSAASERCETVSGDESIEHPSSFVEEGPVALSTPPSHSHSVIRSPAVVVCTSNPSLEEESAAFVVEPPVVASSQAPLEFAHVALVPDTSDDGCATPRPSSRYAVLSPNPLLLTPSSPYDDDDDNFDVHTPAAQILRFSGPSSSGSNQPSDEEDLEDDLTPQSLLLPTSGPDDSDPFISSDVGGALPRFTCGPNRKAHMFSARFPNDYRLQAKFARTYVLGRELGAGGNGFVMSARHRETGDEVAVKFIDKDKVPDDGWAEDKNGRWVPREVMLAGRVDHPNVIRCGHELFDDDLYFYVIQEIHGSVWKHEGGSGNSLWDYVMEVGALPESTARHVFKQVAAGVAALHELGISHCDLKTENILIDSKLNVKIIDLGSAVLARPGLETPQYTVATFRGTVAYAAPEILGERRYEAAPTDVWSLGVILCELVTGLMCTDPLSGPDVLRECEVLDERSEEVQDLVLERCLDVDTEGRATMEEVMQHPWMQ